MLRYRSPKFWKGRSRKLWKGGVRVGSGSRKFLERSDILTPTARTWFWVRFWFPEVQSSEEAGCTDVQIAWPLWVRVFKRTAMITQAGVGSHTLHPEPLLLTFALRHWSRVHIFGSVKAITVKFLVWENTASMVLHPLELTSKVTAEFACNGNSRK